MRIDLLRCTSRSIRSAVGTVLLILLGLLTACRNGASGPSEPRSRVAGFDVAPTNFIRFMNLADHVIITNRMADVTPHYRGFSMSLSGTRMKTFVRDLSNLKRHFEPNTSYNDAAIFCEWQLLFYRHTNMLVSAVFSDSIIECGEQYHDESGALEKLEVELSSKSGARQEEN